MNLEPTLLDSLMEYLVPGGATRYGQGMSPTDIANMALGASSISPIGRASALSAYTRSPALQGATKRVVEAVVPAADEAVYTTISPEARSFAQAAQELSFWDKAKDAVGSALTAMGL